MDAKKIAIKGLFLIFIILSISISLLTALALINFIFNINDKDSLQIFIGALLICSLLWGFTFFFRNH
jgi:hypothetical protein